MGKIMRYLISILFICFCLSLRGQTAVFAAYIEPTPAPQVEYQYLFIFWGESNSGGAAKNDSATAGELEEKPNTFILNNNMGGSVQLEFVPLDIPTNNLIGHAGYSQPTTTHGWELQLSNLATSDDFFNDTVWIVKTGQGGSTLYQWFYDTTNSVNYNIFKHRVDSAFALLQGRNIRPVLLASIGINNMNASLSPSSFKSHYITTINFLRMHIGANTPVIMTKFMAGKQTYDAVIDEIANEQDNCYAVSGTDASLADSQHWGYAGVKTMANRMIDVLKSIYP